MSRRWWRRGGGAGSAQFLVRWHGYGRAGDTWECEANILDPDLVRHFDLFVAGTTDTGKKRGRSAVPDERAEKLA